MPEYIKLIYKYYLGSKDISATRQLVDYNCERVIIRAFYGGMGIETTVTLDINTISRSTQISCVQERNLSRIYEFGSSEVHYV